MYNLPNPRFVHATAVQPQSLHIALGQRKHCQRHRCATAIITASWQQGGNHSTASSSTPFAPRPPGDTCTSPHRLRPACSTACYTTQIDPARCSPSTRSTCTRSWTNHPERGVRPVRLRRQRHLRLARGRRKAGQDSQGALVRGGQGAGRPQYKVVASACVVDRRGFGAGARGCCLCR
ncbi:unnamed protein product [Ectocarpus sp. 13 AM-2016]